MDELFKRHSQIIMDVGHVASIFERGSIGVLGLVVLSLRIVDIGKISPRWKKFEFITDETMTRVSKCD